LRDEAQKCVLLCSNCHAEVEDGMAAVPAEALSGRPPG
jgi:ferredoxin